MSSVIEKLPKGKEALFLNSPNRSIPQGIDCAKLEKFLLAGMKLFRKLEAERRESANEHSR